MAPWKHRPKNTPAPEIPTPRVFPDDLLLEIVAHTDLFTLVRCAAVCKHLRRGILSPVFLRRVTQHAAPFILANLSVYDERRLTLVHPVTPAAESFCHDHLSRFMSRHISDILRKYHPATSRGGLVVLCRLLAKHKHRFDMCVYNPMTGHTTFLSKSPYVQISSTSCQKYILLTAADGIDCSFMLLLINLNIGDIEVHIFTSSSGTWGTLTSKNHHDSPWGSLRGYSHPAILLGGIVHWLADHNKQIFTYDVRTRMSGLVKLPPTNHNVRQLHLATSSDGNVLNLLTLDGFMVSKWLHLPTVHVGGDGWALETMINIEEKLCSLCPNLFVGGGPNVLLELNGSGKRSGDVVLLQVFNQACVVLDMETKEMHTQKWGTCAPLLEIDLPSHLQTMKVFS